MLLDQRPRRLRDHDLAAVRGRGHARRVVDVKADVLVADEWRFTRVQPDPHAQRHALGPIVLAERGLRRRRGAARVDRALKDREERVALGAELAPAAAGERRAKDLVVIGLRLDVALAYLLH